MRDVSISRERRTFAIEHCNRSLSRRVLNVPPPIPWNDRSRFEKHREINSFRRARTDLESIRRVNRCEMGKTVPYHFNGVVFLIDIRKRLEEVEVSREMFIVRRSN